MFKKQGKSKVAEMLLKEMFNSRVEKKSVLRAAKKASEKQQKLIDKYNKMLSTS